MFVAEVRIEMPEEKNENITLIDNLAGAWRKRGQVLGREFPATLTGNVYRIILMLPQRDSLDEQHDSQYVGLSKADLSKAGAPPIQLTILGEDPCSAQPCSCPNHSYFILYTNYVSLESCLRCGDCFRPVPLYVIPHQANARGELHDQLISWQSDYQACDQLQMNCATGEKFGLREISELKSSLSQRGIEVCGNIESATGIPTYYYLHRYRGRSLKSEKKRLCPSCGGEWFIQESAHDRFDFKCDRCQLLSNVAVSIP